LIDSIVITSNAKAWKKAGFQTANWLTGNKFSRQVTQVLTLRYRAIFKEQFRSQGGAGQHGSWASLSRKYAARKAGMFPGQKILSATGAMRNSFTTGSNNIARGRVTSRGIEFDFGSKDPKADFHQFGTSKMPRRRIIDFKERHLRGIGLSVARTMQDGMFTRLFFDTQNNKTRALQVKYTGFERKEMPGS